MGKELSKTEQNEIEKVLQLFRSIVSDQPGRTQLIEHHLVTSSEKAIRQQPYRIPPSISRSDHGINGNA